MPVSLKEIYFYLVNVGGYREEYPTIMYDQLDLALKWILDQVPKETPNWEDNYIIDRVQLEKETTAGIISFTSDYVERGTTERKRKWVIDEEDILPEELEIFEKTIGRTYLKR